MITNINDVCTYYNLFTLFWANTLLTKVYLDFVLAIKVDVMVNNNFNYCGSIDNSFHFCKSCYNMINRKKILKFKSANYIIFLPC